MGSSAGFVRGYCCGSRGRWFNDTTQNEGQIPDVETRLLELADKIQKDEAGEQELRGIADKLLNTLFILSSEQEANRGRPFRSGRSPQCSTRCYEPVEIDRDGSRGVATIR